jgi:hypothetical protein
VPAFSENKRVHAYAGLEENVDEEELRTVGIGEPKLSSAGTRIGSVRTELGHPGWELPGVPPVRPRTRSYGCVVDSVNVTLAL